VSTAAADGQPAIRARGLVKRYGRITAVDVVDLTVSPGDVYGYLGPNGAGKTTTLRMALGLIRPDAGSVQLFGRDPLIEGARALDGVAGFVEAPRFYPYLTGRKNLELVAALDGGDAAARIDAALETVELGDRARDKVGGYSHGMRQRLGLAGALLRDPRLLILDEPATGLDPAGMRDMRRLIRRLAADGMTVLLSSHLMAEVEELCDRVVIISSGRVRYEGALDDLIATTAGRYELRTTDDERAAAIAAAQRGVQDIARDARGLTFAAADERAAAALSIALGEAGVGIVALVPRTATLEELFFRMTEDEARAAPSDPVADDVVVVQGRA
jgi:ABC-2 type transport system ATP-binding protein